MDDYDDNAAGKAAASDDPIPNMDNEDYGTLLEFLTDHHPQQASLRQGLWAGGGAVAGGLLLGPAGGLVGGVAGSLVGYWRAPHYEGIVQQIQQLPPHRQERLLRQVRAALVAAAAAGTTPGMW